MRVLVFDTETTGLFPRCNDYSKYPYIVQLSWIVYDFGDNKIKSVNDHIIKLKFLRKKIMYGLNRYICEVLEEMRTCTKTLNFSIIPSLIEEVQTMANRMEMALSDMKDLALLKDNIHEKKEELKELEKKIAKKKKK